MMLTRSANYDVKCMLCGMEVGQILNGRFLKHTECMSQMPVKSGMRRCCHCGGSLFLDPIDVYPSAINRVEAARIRASEAA